MNHSEELSNLPVCDSGIVHFHHLDEPVSSFRVLWKFSNLFINILVSKTVDTDQMPCLNLSLL